MCPVELASEMSAFEAAGLGDQAGHGLERWHDLNRDSGWRHRRDLLRATGEEESTQTVLAALRRWSRVRVCSARPIQRFAAAISG